MDKTTQRWQAVQDLVQQLVNALTLPMRPDHTAVQAMLDAAAARVKAIDAQPSAPQIPLVVPSLVPAPATAGTTP